MTTLSNRINACIAAQDQAWETAKQEIIAIKRIAKNGPDPTAGDAELMRLCTWLVVSEIVFRSAQEEADSA